MDSEDDPLIGQVLSDRLKITGYIAAGAMGRVYKGQQTTLDRTVAIKVMSREPLRGQDFEKRFYLEASLCARLSHQNIVRIFDYGCHGDDLYFNPFAVFLPGRGPTEAQDIAQRLAAAVKTAGIER